MIVDETFKIFYKNTTFPEGHGLRYIPLDFISDSCQKVYFSINFWSAYPTINPSFVEFDYCVYISLFEDFSSLYENSVRSEIVFLPSYSGVTLLGKKRIYEDCIQNKYYQLHDYFHGEIPQEYLSLNQPLFLLIPFFAKNYPNCVCLIEFYTQDPF